LPQIPPEEFGDAVVPSARKQHPSSVPALQQDSFWDISLRVYGVGDYYKALYYHNRQRVRRPDRIEPGLEILTPPATELRNLYPELCPQTGP
jgi:nucleoid-associated protein YgaU